MPEKDEKIKVSGFRIFLKVMVMFVLLGYIIFSFIKEGTWINNSPCEELVICVKDSARANFVSKEDLLNILDKRHLNPVGRPIAKVSLKEIEDELRKHQFILAVQCYKTASNVVHVNVEQRLPIVRVISETGDNYFIDGNGDKMRHVDYPADVVVATGCISEKYAKKCLVHIGKTLQGNGFWNNQVEQINVLKDGTVELIPRVGNHILYLGKPTELVEKLNKLKLFYDKVLRRVGWNKYSRINVEYSNQIICTKTE